MDAGCDPVSIGFMQSSCRLSVQPCSICSVCCHCSVQCSEPFRYKVGVGIRALAMLCGLELLCQEALKNNSIRFKMNLLKKYQHFMKLSDYSSEMEYRIMVNSEKTDGWFINRDNGILTPYIEKNIVREVEEDNISVPIKWNYSWSCFSGTNG